MNSRKTNNIPDPAIKPGISLDHDILWRMVIPPVVFGHIANIYNDKNESVPRKPHMYIFPAGKGYTFPFQVLSFD